MLWTGEDRETQFDRARIELVKPGLENDWSAARAKSPFPPASIVSGNQAQAWHAEHPLSSILQ